MEYQKFTRQIKEYLNQQFNLPEEQVESMLPEFKKTLSSHMVRIEEVYQQNDLADLGKAAHTIKGAFLNLGLNDCADLALKIEGSAVNADKDVDYSSLINTMSTIVNDIVNE